MDRIAKDKVLLVKWWRQFSHEVSHFRRVVPFVRFTHAAPRGPRRGGSRAAPPATLFAGSWTLVNTHEVAVMSGLAAAHRLGAPYPFADDADAAAGFDQYLSLAHGVSRARGCGC